MSRKVYYRFNPVTETYERVYPTRRQRILAILKQTVEGLGLGGMLILLLYYWIDFPREKRLREENTMLKEQLTDLDRRLDASIAVMEAIAERDNNFYRVIMQAEPISDSRRYAGLENTSAYRRLVSLDDAGLAADINDKMNMLDRQLYSQIQSFDSLRVIASEQQDRLIHIPSIMPVSESALRTMASGYGYRVDPIYGTGKFHEGMDFSAPVGTPVYATGDGKVTDAGWNHGYGNSIDINHGYDYVTRYAHLSKIMVKKGQEVKRGDMIGLVGNTGKSTGPHLHYEVRFKGTPQNPVRFYFQDLTPEQYNDLIHEAENASHVMD